MAGRYATTTDVAPESSRMEIERILRKWGASQYLFGWSEAPGGGQIAVVGFQAFSRTVRLQLPLPSPDDPEFLKTPTGLRRDRGSKAARDAYEQAVRQRWRALVLTIKALLEAVEVGILSFEQAFLASIMLPNGATVGQEIAPHIAEAYATQTIPELLPSLGPKEIES